MQPVEEYGMSREEWEAHEEEERTDGFLDDDGKLDWLAVAKDAFVKSDEYFGTNVSNQVTRNISLFNSKHPSGSKYHSDGYRFRSKIFRPKVRSSIRRHESAAAQAYFASEDIVLCSSENEGNDEKSAGAHIAERLLNYRLKQPSFMWFQTCMGAYQDAMVQGAVVSRQEWKYRERVIGESDYSDVQVLEDTSASEAVPIENCRFDPNSDWRDPVNSSPFWIEIIPMYRCDVKANMGTRHKDASKNWFELSDEELSTADEDGYSTKTVRRSRSEGKTDATDQSHGYSDFDIVWIHRNIIRVDDIDYLYYTLGTKQLLSEPIELYNVYPIGRPYVMGFCTFDTHKSLPAAYTELVSGMQQEINDIANQRLDNVKLVINRRSFVRRNAKVDVSGLTRSVPGGVTMVDDVDKDVRHDAPPDVTSSSYAEQDRLNNDFDELAGSFSGSSVASNRAMNETVGGMEIMTSDASSISEYQLRIFTETWVKPVLRQLLKLEQVYVSDTELISVIAPEVKPSEAIRLLQENVRVKLNVGVGATSPQRRIEKLSLALNTVAGFLPAAVERLDQEEVIKEVFGALGYQDGKRFFKSGKEDPEITKLKQQLQELQQMLQGRKMELDNKIQVEQIRQQGLVEKEQIRTQSLLTIAEINQKIEYIDQQIEAEQNEIKLGQLYIQREAFEQSKKMQEYQAAVDKKVKMSELLMRNDYGMAPDIEEKAGRG